MLPSVAQDVNAAHIASLCIRCRIISYACEQVWNLYRQEGEDAQADFFVTASDRKVDAFSFVSYNYSHGTASFV